MKLSAPIYHLKRKARILAREENIPLHQALDRIATSEGFRGWSLLAARLSESSDVGKIYAALRPGDLLLIAARPGHGKTLMGLELAVEARRAGNRSVFFSLEYTARDCLNRLLDIGCDLTRVQELFEFDDSESLCADYIIRKLESAPCGTLAVIDYLQLLDQRRATAELTVQVRALRAFAQEKGLTIAFLSQIDRSYDPLTKAVPDLRDVRLPNPLDLKLFDKACFMHDGEVRFSQIKRRATSSSSHA